MAKPVRQSLDFESAATIENLPDPTTNQQAATKKYVDDNAGGGGGGAFDWSVRNESGATLTKGTAVYAADYDAVDSLPLVEAADGSVASTARVAGLIKADIANNANGDVVTEGELSGLDTSAWSRGTVLYATTSGALTSDLQPYSREVGEVIYSHVSSGIIKVYPSMSTFQNGTEGQFYLKGGTTSAAQSELTIDDLQFSYWDHFLLRLQTVTPVSAAQDLRFKFRGAAANLTGTYEGGFTTLRLDSGGSRAGVDAGGTDYATLSEDNHNGTEAGMVSMEMKISRVPKTTYTDEFAGTMGGFGGPGYCFVTIIPASELSMDGDQVRLSFTPSSGTAINFDRVYISEVAATGDAYDSDAATLTKLQFSAADGVTGSTDEVITSDWLTYSLDSSKALLVAIDSDVAASNGSVATTGFAGYYKASHQAATADRSGFTTYTTHRFMVSAVETMADGFCNEVNWEGINAQASSVLKVDGAAYLNSGTGVDGIEMNFASGNIAAGANWKLWGIKAGN